MEAPTIPVIPPRPSKSPSKEVEAAPAMPQIPARPSKKHVERSVSPNPARFAQSPLREGFSKGHKSTGSNDYFAGVGTAEPIQRSPSVGMPSVGEEGMEYGALDEAVALAQTSTVSDNLKLHAPKPSLSPETAKERVKAVTRTDSDKAASFGLGRPSSSRDRSSSRQGLRKKPSSTFSVASDQDEEGIPEIGQRVPMNRHLGDVQAPSHDAGPDAATKHHQRKLSSRNLPPGSYGLHGHGSLEEDKLEKAYYEKHPELREKEHLSYRDRPNDFAMSKNDLNRLVRDTVNRPSSSKSRYHQPYLYNPLTNLLKASSREVVGTPTEDVAFQATDYYAYSVAAPKSALPSKLSSEVPKAASDKVEQEDSKGDTIHVTDSNHAEFYSYGGEHNVPDTDERSYTVPILASDEVDFGPNARAQHPAIHPQDRSEPFESDLPTKPTLTRPSLTHRPYSQPEFSFTRLDDVKEYDPLFPEDAAKIEQTKRDEAEKKMRHHFPSKDVWEDAPNSVHYTVEVSTPDVEDEGKARRASSYLDGRPITPAQAFAQYQEELAEKESHGRAHKFLPLQDNTPKPSWIDHQSHLGVRRPAGPKRFPSKDVWEDAPASQLYEAEVSEEPEATIEDDAEADPEVTFAAAASQRPAIPERPKPSQKVVGQASKQSPAVSEKPKPQIPARPVKRGSGDASISEAAAAKPKPPVPARPVGGKIAALQAGFMSDLNKRLQLGPQAPKKEEPKDTEPVEEVEKAPLADARKSRARGPQRRAPSKTTPATTSATGASVVSLTISVPQACWTISPEDGLLALTADVKTDPIIEEVPKTVTHPEADANATQEEVTKQDEPDEATTLPAESSQDVKASAADDEPKQDDTAVEEKVLTVEAKKLVAEESLGAKTESAEAADGITEPSKTIEGEDAD